MKTKLITLLLLASLAMTTLASCSGDASDDTSDTTSGSDTTEAVTTEAPIPLPELDLGGEDFNVYVWSRSYMPVTEESGDLINDATYERNKEIENRFNLNFKFDVRDGSVADYAEWLGVLEATILAGEDTYQLAGGYGYRLALHSLGTNYHNLNAIDAIDFTQPWWPSNITEAGNIGDKLYICFGDFDPYYYDKNYGIFFNKRLAEGYGLTDLYSEVRDYKWTMEKLSEYAKLGVVDLNGDGAMDMNDQYGLIMARSMTLDAFIQAFDIKITETDSDGMPRLLGLTDKYAEGQSIVNDFVHNSGCVGFDLENLEETDLLKAVFMPGKALFGPGLVGTAHILREMEDDFGILPYPMLNEEQGEYITYNAIGNSTGMVIPMTADAETAGAVLEALAYYGNKIVLPEYYERALKTKGARDDESAEMLDIIFSNVEFDFTQYYSYCFGDQKSPSMLMRILTRGNSTGMASAWATDEKLYESTMETIIEALK